MKSIDWCLFTLVTQEHKIVIAEKLSERQSIFSEIALFITLPALITIIIFFIIVWFALGSELRPLQLLKKAIIDRSPDGLQPSQLDHKVIELTPLIHSQNTLFKTLEYVIESEKSFTDNAAYELIRPLKASLASFKLLILPT